jgi:hypothetical protein
MEHYALHSSSITEHKISLRLLMLRTLAAQGFDIREVVRSVVCYDNEEDAFMRVQRARHVHHSLSYQFGVFITTASTV